MGCVGSKATKVPSLIQVNPENKAGPSEGTNEDAEHRDEQEIAAPLPIRQSLAYRTRRGSVRRLKTSSLPEKSLLIAISQKRKGSGSVM